MGGRARRGRQAKLDSAAGSNQPRALHLGLAPSRFLLDFLRRNLRRELYLAGGLQSELPCDRLFRTTNVTYGEKSNKESKTSFMNTPNAIANCQHGLTFGDHAQVERCAPGITGRTPNSQPREEQTTIDDAAIIRRALAKLSAIPEQAQWIAQLPWRIRQLVEARPFNLYYKLRRSPCPSQIVEFCERDQICFMTVFVHSIHSPRLVFDVPACDLRPYHALPRDWQLLLGADFPPLFDLSTLPPSTWKTDEPNHERDERKQYRRSDPKKEALRSFGRIAHWLFW